MDSLGILIRNLRKEKNLPLRTVSAFLDLDQAVLSKAEHGKRQLNRDQVVKLAGYFRWTKIIYW